MNKLKLNNLEINITDKCNLNCSYCANNPSFSSNNKLPLDMLNQVFADNELDSICLTGGEPRPLEIKVRFSPTAVGRSF